MILLYKVYMFCCRIDPTHSQTARATSMLPLLAFFNVTGSEFMIPQINCTGAEVT